MINYSDKIKETMVSKLTAPNAMSAGALSLEVGVPQSTLSRWLREYSKMGGNGVNMKDKALAETAALLVLKKKAQDIWGDRR